MTLGLAACNGDEGGAPVGNDWIGDPNGVTPAPVPTSPPTSKPTSSPTPEPTPTPTPPPTPPPPPPPPEDLYTGPAEVEKYVLKFVADARIQGIDVTPDMQSPKLEIQITSLDYYGSSVIGLCETAGNLRRVTFDPDFWNAVSETQRELLAHHELGHCILYRGHRSDLLSTGLYASIMYPVIMSSSTYTSNYDYYQQELFTWGAAALSGAATTHEATHICNHDNL